MENNPEVTPKRKAGRPPKAKSQIPEQDVKISTPKFTPTETDEPEPATRPWEVGNGYEFTNDSLEVADKQPGFHYEFVTDVDVQSRRSAGYQVVSGSLPEKAMRGGGQRMESGGVDSTRRCNELILMRIPIEGYRFYEKKKDEINKSYENKQSYLETEASIKKGGLAEV